VGSCRPGARRRGCCPPCLRAPPYTPAQPSRDFPRPPAGLSSLHRNGFQNSTKLHPCSGRARAPLTRFFGARSPHSPRPQVVGAVGFRPQRLQAQSDKRGKRRRRASKGGTGGKGSTGHARRSLIGAPRCLEALPTPSAPPPPPALTSKAHTHTRAPHDTQPTCSTVLTDTPRMRSGPIMRRTAAAGRSSCGGTRRGRMVGKERKKGGGGGGGAQAKAAREYRACHGSGQPLPHAPSVSFVCDEVPLRLSHPHRHKPSHTQTSRTTRLHQPAAPFEAPLSPGPHAPRLPPPPAPHPPGR
jgi:hypothetical protein